MGNLMKIFKAIALIVKKCNFFCKNHFFWANCSKI